MRDGGGSDGLAAFVMRTYSLLFAGSRIAAILKCAVLGGLAYEC